jgi:antitoxin component of MazEF toxin-antitoxin module
VIAFQKIILQGNSAMITIPRAAMHFLKWRPGQMVRLTLGEDRTVLVERYRVDEVQQRRGPGIVAPDAVPERT